MDGWEELLVYARRSDSATFPYEVPPRCPIFPPPLGKPKRYINVTLCIVRNYSKSTEVGEKVNLKTFA